MDPITTAIIAAVSAGAITGATKIGEQIISDSYGKLKELIEKKFGTKSKVAKAVKDLESNPKSDARKSVVMEEVANAKVDQDADVIKAAEVLLKAIKTIPGGKQIIQAAIGNQNIQIAGDGNTINVRTPKSKR